MTGRSPAIKAIEAVVADYPFAEALAKISTSQLNGAPWWTIYVNVDLRPSLDQAVDEYRLEAGTLEVIRSGDSLEGALLLTLIALKEGLGL